MAVPRFWKSHDVRPGESLTSVARDYGYDNPGPILAFNAENFPDAIKEIGSKREITKDFSDLRKAMKDGVGFNIDPDTSGAWKSIRNDQITEGAMNFDNPGMLAGGVVTVVSQYPIKESILVKEVRTLEIPSE